MQFLNRTLLKENTIWKSYPDKETALADMSNVIKAINSEYDDEVTDGSFISSEIMNFL